MNNSITKTIEIFSNTINSLGELGAYANDRKREVDAEIFAKQVESAELALESNRAYNMAKKLEALIDTTIE